MMKKLILPFLSALSLLHSKEPLQEKQEAYAPIFEGTLLAYFAENVPPGQCFFEPYLFVGTVNGTYTSSWKAKHRFNNFELQVLWLVETGITSWLDITFTTFENYTSAHGKKSFYNGDTHLSLGFQISKNEPHSWIPDFRLVLQQNFPSGKYQNLNPKKTLADVSGSGSYETWLFAVSRKIIYLAPRNPITVNLTLGYDIPTSVYAKNYNLYGGAPKTSASVKPGKQLLANLAFEYSLTLNWILGLDIHYLHQNKSCSSHPLYGLPSSEQFSLAPCIEYNPSTHFGFELGSWFTVTGRNSLSFAYGIATVYWEF